MRMSPIRILGGRLAMPLFMHAINLDDDATYIFNEDNLDMDLSKGFEYKVDSSGNATDVNGKRLGIYRMDADNSWIYHCEDGTSYNYGFKELIEFEQRIFLEMIVNQRLKDGLCVN